MKKSFTLIEVLVVLLILMIIIALVAPKGVSILDRFNNYIALLKKENKIQLTKADSFFNSSTIFFKENEKDILILKKGFIIDKKTSNDNN